MMFKVWSFKPCSNCPISLLREDLSLLGIYTQVGDHRQQMQIMRSFLMGMSRKYIDPEMTLLVLEISQRLLSYRRLQASVQKSPEV